MSKLLEKKIDSYIVDVLQKKNIDFVRINNSNSKGASGIYYTTAFYPVYSCSRNWPDFTFPFKGKIYMIENGLKVGNKISHQDRKDKQVERMKYWSDNGGTIGVVITSVEGAKAFFKKIKLEK
jgi:hypothetical protein